MSNETTEETSTTRSFTDIRTADNCRSIEAALNSAAEGINNNDYNEVMKSMCEVHHSMVAQGVNPMQRQKVYGLVFDLQCVVLNPRIRRGKASKVSRRLLDLHDYVSDAGILSTEPARDSEEDGDGEEE